MEPKVLFREDVEANLYGCVKGCVSCHDSSHLDVLIYVGRRLHPTDLPSGKAVSGAKRLLRSTELAITKGCRPALCTDFRSG